MTKKAVVIPGVLFFMSVFLFFQKNSNLSVYNDLVDEKYNVYSFPLPDTLFLFDTFLVSKSPHVKEAFDKELMVNTYWHSSTFLSIKRAAKFFPVIEPILKANGLPADFKYLAVVESGLQNLRSPAGARGMWQFMESSGKSLGLEINDNIDQRYHLEKATQAACEYLKDAYYSFDKDWFLAAASYNMGVRGLQRNMSFQNSRAYEELYLNSETARYVYRIAALKCIFENPTQYGFNVRQEDLYKPVQFNVVEVDTAIENLRVFAEQFGLTYRDLKEINPWLRERFLENKTQQTYQIKILKN